MQRSRKLFKTLTETLAAAGYRFEVVMLTEDGGACVHIRGHYLEATSMLGTLVCGFIRTAKKTGLLPPEEIEKDIRAAIETSIQLELYGCQDQDQNGERK